MPITKKVLDEIKYVSLNDYAKNVAKFSTIEDKMKYTTRYILNHNGYQDYNIEEVIHFAKETIADAMVKSKNMDNLSANMFLANPVDYIKAEASKLANEIENSEMNVNPEKQEALKTNCIAIASYLNTEEMNRNINDLAESRTFGVRTHLENKMGGKAGLSKTLNETKPGFFSRMFNTTSKQWRDLDQAFDDFKRNGDAEALANAAKAYITHKIKDYKEGDIISDKLAKFDKTSQAKLMFSINVLNAVNEQKGIEANYKFANANAISKGVTYEQIEEASKSPKVIDLEQLEFQKNLERDSMDNNINNEPQQTFDDQKEININEIEDNQMN